MTETFPNAQIAQSPDSQAASSRPTTRGSTTSKLRDSCHACALSKVKCHKQKPTCLRCAGRGLTCEYFHSKRPGRKRDSRQSISTESNSETANVDRPVSSSSQEQWANAATNGSLSVAPEYLNNLLTPLDALKPDSMSAAECSISASSTSSSSSSGFFFGDLLNIPESGLSSSHTGLSTNFEDFFASPIDFLELESIKQPSGFPHNGIDITKLLIPDDTTPIPFLDTSPTTHDRGSDNSENHMISTHMDLCEPTDSASCCLMPALDLMKRLSTNATSSGLSLARVGGINETSLTAECVIEDNKQAIEAVSTMTNCACADDGYLLTVLAMLILKILARFATVARKHSGDKAMEARDDEGVGRLAAQLVLGELHRVQKLVNLLAPRLQSHKTRMGSKWGVARGEVHITGLEGGGMRTAPFSANILEQVEMDLRKAVSALSARIIHMLRQS